LLSCTSQGTAASVGHRSRWDAIGNRVNLPATNGSQLLT
jgi:hypothetical protein